LAALRETALSFPGPENPPKKKAFASDYLTFGVRSQPFTNLQIYIFPWNQHPLPNLPVLANSV
jgi:hypothetical protein